MKVERQRDTFAGERPIDHGGVWHAEHDGITYSVYVTGTAEHAGTEPLEDDIRALVRRRLAANRSDRGPWVMGDRERTI